MRASAQPWRTVNESVCAVRASTQYGVCITRALKPLDAPVWHGPIGFGASRRLGLRAFAELVVVGSAHDRVTRRVREQCALAARVGRAHHVDREEVGDGTRPQHPSGANRVSRAKRSVLSAPVSRRRRPLAPRSDLACSTYWRPTRFGSTFRMLSRVQPTKKRGMKAGSDLAEDAFLKYKTKRCGARSSERDCECRLCRLVCSN